jgi:hypothetical protein
MLGQLNSECRGAEIRSREGAKYCNTSRTQLVFSIHRQDDDFYQVNMTDSQIWTSLHGPGTLLLSATTQK